MTRFYTRFTILALLLASSAGCWSKASNWKFSNMFDLDKGMPWENDEDDVRTGTPARVVSSWVDTVKHTQGQTSQRGFGGRLLFYDGESNDPIQVEGELVVYAFDEANRDPIDNRPTRRFVFPAEQMALHMSKSAVGPGYSFFLPWDEVGGPQSEISLICRFKPAAGRTIVSEQTRHLLPGESRPGVPAATGNRPQDRAQAKTEQPMYKQLVYEAGSGGSVQQASHQSAADAAPGKRMTTTSISLPDNFRMPSGSSGVRGGPNRTQPQANRHVAPATAPDQSQARPAPSFDGPTAAQSASYQQAAAFSAQFSRQPSAPGGANSLGPQITSPLASVSPIAPAQPQLTSPLAAQTSFPANRAVVGGSQSVNNATPIGPVQPLHSAQPLNQAQPLAQSSMAAETHQPNAAAIPPQVAPHGAPSQPAAGLPSAGGTKVSYLSPAESQRWEQGQRSFGSQPTAPQAPSLPGVR